ncbi:MAG: 50S ribosomal protein L4 [Pseudanabaena sp.]|jgi:large subunit ribosomal protein L4|uniref:50S ribosomal protein L4 n=1 Tax=Pseudanabaena sp. UWO311 TaxID=2487337 RepID=UPI00115A6801|nr:50S ribosomal protein L4 [Pseudanabaena sp. UWO311]MCA6501128.1 50S ribosomal protein L4 [Pseudanabaena sp. M090S1SP2A07QC]MCA6507056.1 50S ribosomal protein L4 [Pseudanabaena sp. M172S2SP2A07QC]MCA6510576.1 50S ribosomal protein L4 [Pseudanabaena sp. M109S1SP2A07QC]MCA6517945.1 50S ribosomal protein L4 [Pseudanabaena sp. M110S1SP2A07QC]MCA6523748.1 50S ribosomal protein L4 [Pseudanabaena sp. M051S1SP2A07QC]MCA6528071.1 50S ribosomal protein L4 [Pseudanabaena sp. M179S2SP2A07QC]MCA6531046
MPTVIDWTGNEVGEVSLELRVAKEASAKGLVHRALVRQLANARQGTASSKTRAEVRGGGRKPFRQKGTGRARAGSTRSPLTRGGGAIFGPKPRDYETKMNRKERRLALRTAFIGRTADLIIVEDFAVNLAQPKTKELCQALERWGVTVGKKTLIITDRKEENIVLSARNIQNLQLIAADQLNMFDILNSEKIVATRSAIAKIHEVYGGDAKLVTEIVTTVEDAE